jgi:hypothetical protein
MISSALFTRPFPGSWCQLALTSQKREGDPDGNRVGNDQLVSGRSRGRHRAELNVRQRAVIGPSARRPLVPAVIQAGARPRQAFLICSVRSDSKGCMKLVRSQPG